jgi:uncharacterized protein YjbI with pentapeptide repeats
MTESETKPENLQVKFVEIEHRFFMILKNILRYGFNDNPSLRNAAWSSLLHMSATSIILPAITGFGVVGFLTIWFAYRSNVLMESQNKLAESMRHAAGMESLGPLFESMQDEINELINDLAKQNISVLEEIEFSNVAIATTDENNLSRLINRVPREGMKGVILSCCNTNQQYRFRLSQPLYARIAAISHSFEPVPSLNNDSLKYSKDRATLLRMLLFSSVDLDTCRGGAVDFSYADLRSSELSGYDLSGLDLEGANFQKANLSGTSFSGTKLENASFNDSKLSHSDFSYTVLPSASDFEGADFVGIKLFNAFVKSSDWLDQAAKCTKNFDRTFWTTRKIRNMTSGIGRIGGIPFNETFDPQDFGYEWEIVPASPDHWAQFNEEEVEFEIELSLGRWYWLNGKVESLQPPRTPIAEPAAIPSASP